MTTTAFRNLLNCQYERTLKIKGEKVTQMVNKAYMTYEDVLKQMSYTMCEEEAELFLMMLAATKFPTREEQKKREAEEKAKQEEAAYRANLAAQKKMREDQRILEERIQESRVLAKTKGKPIFWNDPKLGGTGQYHSKRRKSGKSVRTKPELETE